MNGITQIFLADQIRNQQDDDENVNEQIVITKTAQPRVTRSKPANHCRRGCLVAGRNDVLAFHH
jgi:hypothetical protein